MIRVTFEPLPGGDVSRARTIGIMEIANMTTRLDGTADYAVALKKTPPFAGALNAAWRKGKVVAEQARHLNRAVAGEDDELIVAEVAGHHRTRRGIYDLAYRALRACGLEARNR
ncbi:MAG: hypothetical protein AB7O88_28470 [Reyranellaceae bacterium]